MNLIADVSIVRLGTRIDRPQTMADKVKSVEDKLSTAG